MAEWPIAPVLFNAAGVAPELISRSDVSAGKTGRRGTIQGDGSVAEWSIAPVLKTGDPQGSVSSNLTASAKTPRPRVQQAPSCARPSAALPMHLPVYLINLPHHAERKAHADEQLRRCGLLDAVVFSGGVYGRELSAEQVAEIYDARANGRRFPKQLTPGEIGCYASHLHCWRAIAAASAPMALVIEDDVCLDPDVGEIAHGLHRAAIRFDMVKLIGREQESVLRTVARIGPRQLIDYLRPPSWTGAYLVSREGAAKLAHARARFFRAVDVDLRCWWEVDPAFRLYGIVPYPAQHAHFASVLGTRPPSPYGIVRRRWLQISSKMTYELNLLLRAGTRLLRGRGG